MRFFDRSWVNGELSDGEWEQRRSAYLDQWSELEPALPERVRVFAGISIHDARVRGWHHDLSSGRLKVDLVVGDLQRTYSGYQVEFFDADVRLHPDREPDELLVRDDVELLYDELDVSPGGRFEWRVIASPHGEAAIAFSDVSICLVPSEDPST